MRSHEDRKLIRWDAFHILVIYDCSVAKIIYLQTVSGGNESFAALTKDTCHRPRDVFASSLTGFVPALCPQRNGRSLFSVSSVLTSFLLPLSSNLQVLIQTAQAGLYLFQSSLGCDSWYPLWFVCILLEDTEVEQCAWVLKLPDTSKIAAFGHYGGLKGPNIFSVTSWVWNVVVWLWMDIFIKCSSITGKNEICDITLSLI